MKLPSAIKSSIIPLVVTLAFGVGMTIRLVHTADQANKSEAVALVIQKQASVDHLDACAAVDKSNAALLHYLTVQFTHGTITRSPQQKRDVKKFLDGLKQAYADAYTTCINGK